MEAKSLTLRYSDIFNGANWNWKLSLDVFSCKQIYYTLSPKMCLVHVGVFFFSRFNEAGEKIQFPISGCRAIQRWTNCHLWRFFFILKMQTVPTYERITKWVNDRGKKNMKFQLVQCLWNFDSHTLSQDNYQLIADTFSNLRV